MKDPRNGPKMNREGGVTQQGILDRMFQKILAPRCPKKSQDNPKYIARYNKRGHDGPKMTQDGSRVGQDCLKIVHVRRESRNEYFDLRSRPLSCVFACLIACLLVCLLAGLLACLLACFLACLPACLLAYLLACLPACLLACLLAKV